MCVGTGALRFWVTRNDKLKIHLSHNKSFKKIVNKINRILLHCGNLKGGGIEMPGWCYLAILCNSTVFEIGDDINQVSERFIDCQISGYTALLPPLPWEPISISQAFLYDSKEWPYL
jgi:hypothetical protein